MIRAKPAPYAPSAMYRASFPFRNYNICTKQKYGTALVLILETVSQEILVKSLSFKINQIDVRKHKNSYIYCLKINYIGFTCIGFYIAI